jgi:hypothetical protein
VALAHRPEQLLAGIQLAQVAGTNHRLGRAAVLDRLGRSREIGRGGRRQHQARALARERLGDGASNAAAAARDDHNFPAKFTWHEYPHWHDAPD